MTFDLDEYMNQGQEPIQTSSQNKSFDLDEYMDNTKPVQQPVVQDTNNHNFNQQQVNEAPIQPLYYKEGQPLEAKIERHDTIRAVSHNPIKNLFMKNDDPKLKLQRLGWDLRNGGTDFINSFVKSIASLAHLPAAIYNNFSGKKHKNDEFNEYLDRTYKTSSAKFMNTAGHLSGDLATLFATGGASALEQLTGRGALGLMGAASSKEAPKFISNFVATHPQAANNVARGLVSAAEDAGIWGAGSYGLEKLAGNDPEASLGQYMGTALLGGQILRNAPGVAGKVSTAVKNSKVGRNVKASRLKFERSHPELTRRVKNTQAQLWNMFNPSHNSGDKEIQNYRILDNLLSKNSLDAESQLSNKQLEMIRKAQELSPTLENQIQKEVQYGRNIEPDSTTIENIKKLNELVSQKQQPKISNIETLNKIENAIDNGLPVTKETIYPKKQLPTNDTESIVGKLNELNGNKTLTSKEKISQWKNKYSKHNNISEQAGSPVKNETGINTHENIETPQNEPSYISQNKHPNNKELPKKIIENNHTSEQPLEDMKVTRLEYGDAEGSHTSMRDLSMERPDTVKSKESTLEVIDEIYNADSHINEEVPLKNRYASDDAEFNKWYDKYEKADSETRTQMQKDKMTDFNSQEESIDFYNKFTKQVDRDKIIAERNQTSPSITEDDVMNFASNYKAADILPSATKQAKTAEKELLEQSALENGSEIMRLFGYGKSKNGINEYIAKNVSKQKGKTADKELTRLIKARLGNFKSKISLDKYVEQKTAELDKLGGNLAPRAKSLLNDAYKELSVKRGYTNKNINYDLTFQLRKNNDIATMQTKAGRIKAAKEAFFDQADDMGLKDNKVGTTAIAKSLLNATDVRMAEHYISTVPSINSYFNNEEKELLKNIRVITTKDFGGIADGLAVGEYGTILIKDGANIAKSFRHEGQHITDYKRVNEIYDMPDSEPLKVAYLELRDAYNKATNFINNNKTAIDKIEANLDKENWSKIQVLGYNAETGTIKDVENFKNLVNNIFGKGSKKAQLEIDFVNSGRIYLKDPLEVRSINASNGIKNTKSLDDSILERHKEYQGEHNGNRPFSEQSDGEIQFDLSRSTKNKFGMEKESNRRKSEQFNIKSTTENKQPIGIKSIKDDVESKISNVNDFVNLESNLKDLREETLIKYGIIDEAQAEARKAMQEEGNARYMQTNAGYKKQKPVSDLDRDYNESKNSKIGVFGRKESDKIKLSKQADRIKDDLTTIVKADNAHAITDFATKTWGVPLDKEVKGEFIPVNKKLLTQALYQKNSREWYNTIVRGEKDIDKAFGKYPEVAKAYKLLHESVKEPDCKIPEYVFNQLFDGSGENATQYIERYWNMNYDKVGSWGNKARGIGKYITGIVDGYQSAWKRNKLATLSFVINNRLGNQMLLASHGGIDYLNSFLDAVKTKDIEIPNEILSHNIGEAYTDFMTRRTFTGNSKIDGLFNLINGVPLEKVDTSSKKIGTLKGITQYKKNPNDKPSTHIKNVGKTLANIEAFTMQQYNKLATTINKINEAAERFERKQAYSIAMKKHVNKQKVLDVAKRTLTYKQLAKDINDCPEAKEAVLRGIEDMLGNYRTFNKWERGFLKRLRPFYSWDRTIIRSTLQLCKDNPSRAFAILYNTNKLKDIQNDRKEYQQGSIDLPFKDSRNKQQLLINKREYGIPWSSLPGMEDKRWYEGLSPLVTVPLEATRGKKFFLNREFNDQRYFAYKEQEGSKKNTYYYDRKTGKKLDKLPLNPRIGYVANQLGQDFFVPYMNNNLIQGNNLLGFLEKDKQGKRTEYDTPYDTSLGGFRDGDDVGFVTKTSKRGFKYKSKLKRHSAQNTSETTKLLKRTGLSIQTKTPLNYWDKKEKAEKLKAWKAKHKKK